MPTPRRPERRLALVALAGASLVLLAAAGGSGRQPTERGTAPAWRGLVGAPRPPVSVGQRTIVVLKAPSLAQRLELAGGVATESQERAWTAGALAAQAQLLAFLAANGVYVAPEFRFARVLNGFSASLDPRAIGLLERSPDVQGVYSVRIAYPASAASKLLADSRFGRGQGRRPDVELPGETGEGVTIALLDTGVDRRHPYLRGRVEAGFDVIAGDEDAAPAASPEAPGALERHGTEMAGLLVGRGGPAGLAGVALGATVLPIRVAGWQPDAAGRFAVYARTDQLIAGLERAVDPNADGDAHDAARVALVPLAEPFAAFADSPEATAVDGALSLDMLVVTPAGNDGAAGPSDGSISGPSGAEGALAVGAADARPERETVRVVLRRGLEVELSRALPLLNASSPGRSTTLGVAAPATRRGISTPSFFDQRGFSLVAGKAALVPAGDAPSERAVAAVRAGAAAVLLYGDRLPAGSLGLDVQPAVPVVSVPAAPALAVLAAQRAGANVGVSIGRGRREANPGFARVAPFSSRGLAFDGTVKPELVAPGVELLTSEPGGTAPRYGTIYGSSASAALVAGAAVLLAQARPSADAQALKGLLVGSGRKLEAASITAQGGGLLEVGAAAAAEVVSKPAAIGFGTATGPGWAAGKTISVRNVSTRRLEVSVTASSDSGESELLGVTVEPRRLTLRQGAARDVIVTIWLAGRPATALEAGSIVIVPDGGQAVRVPWAAGLRPYRGPLVSQATLSQTSFRPSDRAPVVLSFRAGQVTQDGGLPQVQPVGLLEVRLITADGRWLGVVGRLRDVLPGRYAFGLTGRDPQGTLLPPGGYRLQLVAWPVPPGEATRVALPFSVR